MNYPEKRSNHSAGMVSCRTDGGHSICSTRHVGGGLPAEQQRIEWHDFP
jgi:hypothetical protein